jgi:hypothetical protein
MKLRALLCLAFVMACGPSEATSASSASVVGASGVDYSWARPDPGALHGEGYTFAARYLSHDTSGKSLSAGEADALWAAGIDMVVVWEDSGTAALNGFSQGVADAQAADAQAAADGMPAGRPIYFAVDFDAQAYQQGAIDAYFNGVASVIGHDRTGAYGGYSLIQRSFDDGVIAWGWQTYAWSYGNWDPRAQLRQVQNGITAAGDGDCCDRDESAADDFGQWHHSSAPFPNLRSIGSIAVGVNADGRLEAFAAGADWQLWHQWQTKAGGSWWGFWPMTGNMLNAPAVAANADGRLEVFVHGSDRQLWHQWQTTPGGAWSGFVSMAGQMTDSPAVIANADGRLEVFVRGVDAQLWHQWQVTPGGAWSGFAPMTGNMTDTPAVARNADGRLEVFVRGSDGQLWHQWQWKPGAAWSGFFPMTGSITDSPAVAMNADGRLEVFVRGSDAQMWHQWQLTPGGGWSSFAPMQGNITGSPAVIANADGRLEAFVRGADGSMWHQWQWKPGAAWSGFASLQGQMTDSPVVSRNKDGRLEAFVRGADGGLWHQWQSTPGGAWSGFVSLGGQLE